MNREEALRRVVEITGGSGTPDERERHASSAIAGEMARRYSRDVEPLYCYGFEVGFLQGLIEAHGLTPAEIERASFERDKRRKKRQT